jgi:hypothetical protein
MQIEKGGLVRRGSMNGDNILYDATSTETGGEVWVSVAIMLVGAIPCPVTNSANDKENHVESTTR